MKDVLKAHPHPDLLPQEKEWHENISGFLECLSD
jgi:hypothetical protein